MIHQSHLNTAIAIISAYGGAEPLHLFCKKFFSAQKKYGGRDRKKITTLCFQYFRLGHAVPDLDTGGRIILAHFLCENEPSAFLQHFRPEWNNMVGHTLADKLDLIKAYLSLPDIFSFYHDLSTGVAAEPFARSFLIQPLLYLRVRPGKEEYVHQQLAAAQLSFDTPMPGVIALPNMTKTETILQHDKDVVVQDLSSQRVGRLLQQGLHQLGNTPIEAWDCCAASGGKSILLHDLSGGKCNLTVSDIRPSILHNLKDRFTRAGIQHYRTLIADLSVEHNALLQQKLRHDFNLIICDAPCSGSGTWSRTPEQLYFYDRAKTAVYAALQQQILRNAVTYLAKNGVFLYITCSVFEKENEEAVRFIRDTLGLKLLDMEVIPGYAEKADTMFAALFVNNK